MRAGMGKILTFEIYFCAAKISGQSFRKIERRRPSDIGLLEQPEFIMKLPVLF